MKIGNHSKRDEYVAERSPRLTFWGKVKDFFIGLEIIRWMAISALVSLFLCVMTRGWNPPFTFIGGACPNRDIVCLVPFSIISDSQTKEDRESARFDTPHIYINHPEKLTQFKETLINRVTSLMTVQSFDRMSEDGKAAWNDFFADGEDSLTSESLQILQKALAEDTDLNSFKTAINTAFQAYAANGLLLQLHPAKSGNQEKIRVYEAGSDPSQAREVPARDVLVGNMYQIKDNLNWNLYSPEVSEIIFTWIKKKLEPTLTEDTEATRRAQDEAEKQVEPHLIQYEKGKTIVRSGERLTPIILSLLTEEYRAILKELTIREKLVRAGGFCLLIFLAAFLINVMVFCPIDRRIQIRRSMKTSVIVFILMSVTVVAGRYLQDSFFGQFGSLELIPLLVFAMLITLSFSWSIGFVICFLLVLVLSLAGTNAIAPFLVMTGAYATTTFMAKDVQKRTDFLSIAFVGMIVTFLISIGSGLLEYRYIPLELIKNSVLNTCWVLVAVMVTGAILPFLEQYCDLLTPMHLVEIGDPSNPLLRRMIDQAPATYSHSIATAVIAENAAREIGANAQLVRVGAYFHDIGKLLKPDYFTENQKSGENPHNNLEPRMSTLILIGHVKDGVSMALNNHLPIPIVDLIEQHHGTFPIMGFYDKANKASIAATGQGVDINQFRYPGPIPQTKEAGILMMADAIESAGRSIVGAQEAQRKNLIHQIIEKRLQDGQFDESGLTLGEIRKLETNFINSVISVNHTRIKYPGQEEREKALAAAEAAAQGGSVPENPSKEKSAG